MYQYNNIVIRLFHYCTKWVGRERGKGTVIGELCVSSNPDCNSYNYVHDDLFIHITLVL